jgi:serine protease Do
VTLLLSALLCLAPEEPDELIALQTVVRSALAKVGPSVVTIETVGGIRQTNVPDRFKEKMTLPERPRDGDRNAPEDDGDGDEEKAPPEGKTPRFKNEWRKMLAWPGFKKAEGPTTGVVLSPHGHIVTSAWNFEGKPNVVTVTTADGKTHAARLLGIDRAAGLALLKIDAKGLTAATFLAPDHVRVGAWALAVGRTLERHGVDVKYGIISAKNRIEGNALQTDAATSPANYGGPLIDAAGHVYGIIVPLGARGEEANPNWYDSGIGFATPIPDLGTVIARLGKAGTELWPAFLGVSIDRDRTASGARLTEVAPEQPADKAGLEKDDVILTVDGREVDNAFALRFEIGRRRAGDSVTLKVRRGQQTLEIAATLGRRPKAAVAREKLPVPMPGPGGRKPRPGER